MLLCTYIQINLHNSEPPWSITSVLGAMPCITVHVFSNTHLCMYALTHKIHRYINREPLGVIITSVWGALPCAIGLFPQQSSLHVSKLEPQFQVCMCVYVFTRNNLNTHNFGLRLTNPLSLSQSSSRSSG